MKQSKMGLCVVCDHVSCAIAQHIRQLIRLCPGPELGQGYVIAIPLLKFFTLNPLRVKSAHRWTAQRYVVQ